MFDRMKLQVLANHARAAAENMAHTLHRTAHSAFVKETEDFTVMLISRSGDTFAVPMELGATWYPGLSWAPAIEMVDDYKPGDVAFTNDPYSCFVATHAPDTHLWKPVFHEGEIVGLFGMAAGGQFAVLESVFGWRHEAVAGELSYTLDGRRFAPRHPAAAIAAGVFMSPADRESDGLVKNLTARENTLLPWLRGLSRFGWIGARTGEAPYRAARESLKMIGPGGGAAIGAFSGGNKQKHLLARWMFPRTPRVLLLNQPTQGVDIGAKNDIVRALRALAASGVTVVVASSESDEIARMCDRAYTIYSDRAAEIAHGPHMEEELLRSLLELAAA